MLNFLLLQTSGPNLPWEAVGVLVAIFVACSGALGAWLNLSVGKSAAEARNYSNETAAQLNTRISDLQQRNAELLIRVLNVEGKDAEILKRIAEVDEYAHVKHHEVANVLQKHEGKLLVMDETKTLVRDVCESFKTAVSTSLNTFADKLLRQGQPDRRRTD